MSREENTRNKIIEILSEKWPLTTKQIHHRLQRNYGISVSYQAVHKHLKQMIEEKMLKKDGKNLLLSYNYIKRLSEHSKKLEESLQRKQEDGSTMLVLDSIVECGKFLINEFMGNELGKYGNPEKKDCVCAWNYAWSLVGASQEEHEKMKKMFSKTIHWNICAHSTFLDKVTSKYAAELGKKVVLNQKLSVKSDIFVEGDYIMEVHFPEKLERDMHKLYNRVKSEKDFDMKQMFEFGSKKYGIKIVIFKNQELADSLREEAKKIYEENEKNRLIVEGKAND